MQKWLFDPANADPEEGEEAVNFDFVTNATAKELEQFKSVCNQLLSRTYIVRTIYQPGKGRVDNPDYLFLSRHYEAVQEYLSLLDWDLRRDELNGYFYVLNTDEANRCNLNKKETAILLALRLIYEENMERLGLEQDAMCTVRDVLEKVVTDYPVFPAKPNMEEVKRAFTGKPFCDSKTGRKIQPRQLQDRNTAHHSLCGLQRKAELGGVCFKKGGNR